MTTVKTLVVVLLALAWAPVVGILVLLLSWWIVVLVSDLDRQLWEWPAADPPEELQREARERPSVADFVSSLPRCNESPTRSCRLPSN